MASATERAITRLESALRLLEAARERRLEEGIDGDDLAAETHSLSHDRARLAEQLDQAQSRVATLEERNREAAARIGTAMETIAALLPEPAGRG